MAESTDRAPFPDPDRPLYTPDEDAQRQVVARIAQAREGKRTRTRAVGLTVGFIIRREGLPMGEHPRVGREVLADAWGMKHTAADNLAKQPERMDPWQVRQLCHLCGVTLEWLRGWDATNGFGLYMTAEDVAAAYARLSTADKTLVCDLLTRLLGADEVRAIEAERWERDNQEWLDRHPEVKRKLAEASEVIRAFYERATARLRETAARAAQVATAPFTNEDIAQMRQTADRLRAQGVDVDHMPARQLLDYARGDSVEG